MARKHATSRQPLRNFLIQWYSLSKSTLIIFIPVSKELPVGKIRKMWQVWSTQVSVRYKHTRRGKMG